MPYEYPPDTLLTNSTSLPVVSTPSAGLAEAPAEDVDPDELARRTEFLKNQRDKLLAMKKAEREKQLEEVEQKQLKSRPKSARAARLVDGLVNKPNQAFFGQLLSRRFQLAFVAF